ncbi:hypothetical protein F5X68DRAFT_273168 [Plectosphaerella plurivora]|uniref:Uncharacterized protein n=1 Tax=Plectosphaerella plurivora TaxID=936078 RepID=A0A9P8VKS7_9PEZI|nr:hypothetical protein F5X68DRAFT_273168 [Plectosphaerella plurivora]
MDVPGPPMEKELFDHARRFTVPSLALASGPSLFWYQHALPLSHTVKPVKHALCAFAAAHRTFLSRDRRHPFGPPNDLAIEHYNRAISQIQPLMSNPTPENIDAVLVCCVIFTTLENMVGRHTESLRHLHAGWRLLESYQPKPLVQDPASDGTSTTNPQLFDDVAGMLSRLHLDTTIYVTDELVPTHGSFLRPELDMGPLDKPFASAADAEEALHHFDIVFTSFIESTFADCDPYVTDPGPLLKEPTTPFVPGLTWDILEGVLVQWQTRFNLYYSDLRQSGTASADELRKATVLALHLAAWKPLMRIKNQTEDLTAEECLEIVEIAESLAPSLTGSETSPIFSFTVEIVPSVTLAGLSCGDNIDLQQRVVKLLRSLHRRESVWDSQDMAEILEGIYLAKAQGILDPATLPWGMSEMAGVLAQLQVPTVGSGNGALGMLMAKSKRGGGG